MGFSSEVVVQINLDTAEGQAALAELMRDRPGIADEIAVTLSQRARTGTSGAVSDHSVADARTVSALVSRIRQLFSDAPHRSSMR